MKPPSPEPGKKSYETPRLLRYGHIWEITRNTGVVNKNDGGAMGNTKTG